jgi:hypothetical protein
VGKAVSFDKRTLTQHFGWIPGAELERDCLSVRIVYSRIPDITFRGEKIPAQSRWQVHE